MRQVLRAGYARLPGIFEQDECARLIDCIEQAAAQDHESDFLHAGGQVFAARNVQSWMPEVLTLWRRPILLDLLLALLGDRAGLVRALYFDKPAARSWSLPMHQDCTIAVHHNQLPSARFAKPTMKSGVPHVEAPRSLLEEMLTLRIHLDPATTTNGCLEVVEGSHHGEFDTGANSRSPIPVQCAAGDILAMRPLLAHGSSHVRPALKGRPAAVHRRILHLEFAGTPELPDGYDWDLFVPALPSGSVCERREPSA